MLENMDSDSNANSSSKGGRSKDGKKIKFYFSPLTILFKKEVMKFSSETGSSVTILWTNLNELAK